ncbi:MAG: TraA family conjugative transfer protein [Steroidobacteraceae bacterium]
MNPLHRSAADETLIASTNERVVGRSLLGATRDSSRRLPALALMGLMLVCGLVLSNVSFAGTGGTEFNSAYTTITDWLQGDLGRLIAASLLVVGLVMGVVRQSIMAAVPAIACGLVATVAPTIIGAVVTAVI